MKVGVVFLTIIFMYICMFVFVLCTQAHELILATNFSYDFVLFVEHNSIRCTDRGSKRDKFVRTAW